MRTYRIVLPAYRAAVDHPLSFQEEWNSGYLGCREWSCYPKATPYEFFSGGVEIEAKAATKRNPKPSTQHRSGLGSLLPHFGF